jgi:hypothetical protein
MGFLIPGSLVRVQPGVFAGRDSTGAAKANLGFDFGCPDGPDSYGISPCSSTAQRFFCDAT